MIQIYNNKCYTTTVYLPKAAKNCGFFNPIISFHYHYIFYYNINMISFVYDMPNKPEQFSNKPNVERC